MDPIACLHAKFKAAMQELRKENTFIKDQLIAQQSKLINHSPSNCRPKPCLPDPEKFAGQSLKFDTWLPSIKAKLKIDGEAIGDATAQFYYVYLNLDSNVQAMVLPQLHHAEETGVWNFNTILE